MKQATRFVIDGREFIATEEATKNVESWRKAFPMVYGNMPAVASRAFALRDFNAKHEV